MVTASALEQWLFTNSRGRTVTLHGGAYLRLTGRAGEGQAPIDMHTRRAPYQRGDSFLAARVRGRALSLRVIAVTSDLQTCEAVLRELAEVMDPEWGTGTLTVIREDGVRRALDCVVTDGLQVEHSATDFWVTRLPLSLYAPDPYWYDPTDQEITFSGTGSGLIFPFTFPITFTNLQPAIGAVSTIVNVGSAPAEPVFELDGPMVAPRITHLGTGRVLAFRGDIPDGAMLTIDSRFGQKTWTLAAYGTEYQEEPPLTSESSFFELAAGENAVLITNSGPGAGGTARLRFRPRYVAL